MSQFGQLKALHVKDGDTAEFVFEELEGFPSLTCKPATNINKAFLNAVMAASKQASRIAKAKRKIKGKQDDVITQAAIDKARMDDIELFVDHVVMGWEDVVNQDGEPVEFSKENCRDFLQAIPPEMFTELRLFCLDIRNFRPEAVEMDPEEQETLQGKLKARLLWELEYDQKSHAFDQHWSQGVPLNRGLQEFIDSEPDLEPFEDVYMRAFWRLVTERRGGPVIPYSEIEKYATKLGLESAMIETFCEVIWSLDRAHTDWARATSKSAAE